MFQIVLWCFAIATALVVALNAAFMAASPRAWFRLPGWLRTQGSLTERKYATGSGAIQVRITGALILFGMVWCLYETLKARR